jgi:hypothetical protein
MNSGDDKDVAGFLAAGLTEINWSTSRADALAIHRQEAH